MCRPAQEGISHLQDAQDLVRGQSLAQDLVHHADEKSIEGESDPIFLAFCIFWGFKQL